MINFVLFPVSVELLETWTISEHDFSIDEGGIVCPVIGRAPFRVYWFFIHATWNRLGLNKLSAGGETLMLRVEPIKLLQDYYISQERANKAMQDLMY